MVRFLTKNIVRYNTLIINYLFDKKARLGKENCHSN